MKGEGKGTDEHRDTVYLSSWEQEERNGWGSHKSHILIFFLHSNNLPRNKRAAAVPYKKQMQVATHQDTIQPKHFGVSALTPEATSWCPHTSRIRKLITGTFSLLFVASMFSHSWEQVPGFEQSFAFFFFFLLQFSQAYAIISSHPCLFFSFMLWWVCHNFIIEIQCSETEW